MKLGERIGGLVQPGVERAQRLITAATLLRNSMRVALRHVNAGDFPNPRDPDQRSCIACTGPLKPKLVENITDEVWRNTCRACGWVDWDAPIPVVAGLMPFPERYIGRDVVEGPFEFVEEEYEDPSQTGVVLVKRKFPPFQGQWALYGGYMMRGETPRKSLHSEGVQEVGIDGQLERFLHPCAPALPNGKRLNHVVMHGLVRPVNGRLQAMDDALEAGIFGASDRPRLCFGSHEKTLQDYFDGRNGRIMGIPQYP